ncbi:MAG: glycosyltransferase family 4 protein [Thermodesulfobacteriota bacterium]|nr:glycosyltransferase family 4 protein [Thermodesulfobacteriota bacterium]
MKILFTNTGPWGTGSATVVDALGLELMRRGHQVKIFFPDCHFESMDMDKYYKNPEVYQIWDFPIQKRGIELYTFPLIITDPHPRNYHHAWTFKKMDEDQFRLYMHEFRRHIKRIVESFKPDIIECQHIWAMDHVIMELGYPYISAAHHSDQMGFRYDPGMREYAISASRNAQYIFAISEHVREEVLDLYPVDPEKVVVIGNGYNQETFKPQQVDRSALLRQFHINMPDDVPIITFAGKLSKTKGVDILLLANRLVQEDQEVHFLLFGSGELEDALDKDKYDLYCQDNVHILGHQTFEILSQFHNIAHSSILPSRSEGFGIAALEAMGCGTPVVVTRTGGPDKFAVGDIVEKENPKQLADAILRMLSLSDGEYKGMRDKAHKVALQFSWTSVVETRLHYYELLRQRFPVSNHI